MLNGLRHFVFFAAALFVVTWFLGVSDDPRPDMFTQGQWTRVDVGFGFIIGWIAHVAYRMALWAWCDYRREVLSKEAQP